MVGPSPRDAPALRYGPRTTGRCVVRGAWCAAMLVACAAPPPGDPESDIAAMLRRSASDWNRGDLAGFMSDYAHDSLTSYVSAGDVVYGWQTLFDRYQTTYFAPGKSRESLAFEEVHVRPLARDLALCTARFRLVRRESLTASGAVPPLAPPRGRAWGELPPPTPPPPHG